MLRAYSYSVSLFGIYWRTTQLIEELYWVSNLASNGMLLSISSPEWEWIDNVRFFRIIGQWPFDFPLAYFDYRLSGEVDWSCVRCLGLFTYKAQTTKVLILPERLFPGTKRYHDGTLMVEKLLQVDNSYGSFKRFTSSDAQNAARLELVESDNDDKRRRA